jgi:hypothetical protein
MKIIIIVIIVHKVNLDNLHFFPSSVIYLTVQEIYENVFAGKNAVKNKMRNKKVEHFSFLMIERYTVVQNFLSRWCCAHTDIIKTTCSVVTRDN